MSIFIDKCSQIYILNDFSEFLFKCGFKRRNQESPIEYQMSKSLLSMGDI